MTEMDAVESDIDNMATITISNTGKGISPDSLRSKLYTPSAQENTLAPGTGLGLSILGGIVIIIPTPLQAVGPIWSFYLRS